MGGGIGNSFRRYRRTKQKEVSFIQRQGRGLFPFSLYVSVSPLLGAFFCVCIYVCNKCFLF